MDETLNDDGAQRNLETALWMRPWIRISRSAALLIGPFAIGENSRGDKADCTPGHQAEDAENGGGHDRCASWLRAPNTENTQGTGTIWIQSFCLCHLT